RSACGKSIFRCVFRNVSREPAKSAIRVTDEIHSRLPKKFTFRLPQPLQAALKATAVHATAEICERELLFRPAGARSFPSLSTATCGLHFSAASRLRDRDREIEVPTRAKEWPPS